MPSPGVSASRGTVGTGSLRGRGSRERLGWGGGPWASPPPLPSPGSMLGADHHRLFLLGPAGEQCGLYARRGPGPPGLGSNMAPRAAPPGHGEGWRLGRAWAGPAPPSSSGQPLSGQPRLLPPPSPTRAPPPPRRPRLVVGSGVRPTRLCHVCHPPGTQEHLSKIPGGRGRAAAAASGPPSPGSQCQMRAGDKSSIFLVLLGWSRASPSTTWLLAALPPGAGVAEAQAAPARTEGTDGQGWLESRTPEGPSDRGWHLGTACWPAGPAPLLLPPCPAGPGGTLSTSLLWRKLLTSSRTLGKSPSSLLLCWRQAEGSAILCSMPVTFPSL